MSWKYNPLTDEIDYYQSAIEIQAFPVGSYYFNATGADPNTELGYGTWTQVAQGQFLVGAT